MWQYYVSFASGVAIMSAILLCDALRKLAKLARRMERLEENFDRLEGGLTAFSPQPRPRPQGQWVPAKKRRRNRRTR
jgi:hypothetical protein